MCPPPEPLSLPQTSNLPSISLGSKAKSAQNLSFRAGDELAVVPFEYIYAYEWFAVASENEEGKTGREIGTQLPDT